MAVVVTGAVRAPHHSASGGIIDRVGRECCSVKVHYSFYHVSHPQLWSRMAPGLTQEAAPPALFLSVLYLPSLLSSPTFTFPLFYQSLFLPRPLSVDCSDTDRSH